MAQQIAMNVQKETDGDSLTTGGAATTSVDDQNDEMQMQEYKDMDEDQKLIFNAEKAMRRRRTYNDLSKEVAKFKFSVYVLGVCRLDSRTQSYRCRFEVSCFTQMTKQQKLDYIKDPDNYVPDDQMQVYSLNTVEIIERKQMTFHNQKTFIVYYDEDFKVCELTSIHMPG